jgi:hypothetical protein
MSSQLFLTSLASDLGGAGQLALAYNRGSGSTTAVTNTTASGTDIPVTATAGGQALTWFSPQLAVVTIAGSITVNVRGLESSTADNAGAGIKIEHCSSNGTVLGTILADTAVTGTEFGTSDAASNASFTPTSTIFASGDRVKVTLTLRNVGTMAAGTATNSYNGTTAAAAGDTYVTFTETLAIAMGDNDTGAGSDSGAVGINPFTWSGYTWEAKATGGPSVVGSSASNYWDSTGVAVSGSNLDLTIKSNGTHWTCAAVSGPQLGYGTYTWVINADPIVDGWDVNYVLELFTFDSTSGATTPFAEIDIEFGLLGSATSVSPGLFINQPATGAETHTSAVALTGVKPYTCSLTWQAGQVYWKVVDADGNVCGEHVCADAVQVPRNASVQMSLWLQGGSGVPADGQGVTIAIESFAFTGAATHALEAASAISVPLTSKMSNWLLHRPGPDAPAALTPFVAIPSPASDVPNGTLYNVQSLIANQNARFGSDISGGATYSVLVAAYSWHAPTVARTVTVTAGQFEYPGDVLTSAKQASVARTTIPSNDSTNNLLFIGEITLPINYIAADNTDAYFAIGITSTDTADRFYDILLLDTTGQTILCNIPSSVSEGYDNYYVDAPSTTTDIGPISGSTSGRGRASSVMEWVCPVGVLTVDPGSNLLFVYSTGGTPGLIAAYSAAWWMDRTQ